MKSLVKMGAVLLTALTLTAYTASAQTPETSPSTNAPAAPKPRPHQISGKIASIDTAGKSISVTNKNGTETIQITTKTKISKSGAPATLEDAKVGEPILAAVTKDEAGNWVALRVRLGAARKKAAPSTNAPPAAQ